MASCLIIGPILYALILTLVVCFEIREIKEPHIKQKVINQAVEWTTYNISELAAKKLRKHLEEYEYFQN